MTKDEALILLMKEFHSDKKMTPAKLKDVHRSFKALALSYEEAVKIEIFLNYRDDEGRMRPWAKK